MDPAPGRSFLEWAVRDERTVFAISYRNLDPLIGGVTLHDYLGGPREALDVITTEITGAPKIDISYKTGALMGGTVRYVLSSGGHIAGIVNPPGPKGWYEAAGYAGPDPRGLARFGHQAPRLVAGGPDDLGRPRDRRRRKAASHGQRASPGHRGYPGRVRARLVRVRQTGNIGGTPWVR